MIFNFKKKSDTFVAGGVRFSVIQKGLSPKQAEQSSNPHHNLRRVLNNVKTRECI